MPESEKKKRAGGQVSSIPIPKTLSTDDSARDESNQYGDDADIPTRMKKAKDGKSGKGKVPAKKRKVSAIKLPFQDDAKSKKRTRKKRRTYKSLFELMSASGSDSFFKPIRLFGREIRFWPLIVLAAIVLLASGVMLNNSNLSVAEQTVTIVGLPEDMEGYRIIVLSDMNGKRFGDSQGLLLRTLNGLKYDAIFCLGDMVGSGGDARPFLEFLEGLRDPSKVYFICGDSDPGPYVKTARGTEGVLSQLVLEDWIVEAMALGAHYVDAPMSVPVRSARLWLSPATLLNLETVSTLQAWQDQTDQEIEGVRSGINEDYNTLPITSYRYRLAQQLYDSQRGMSATDIHISLAHEMPAEDFIYTSQEHDTSTERYLSSPELLLAGHYCGGVWRIPFLGAFYVPDKSMNRGGWFPNQQKVAGLSSLGDTQTYITKGLSTTSSIRLMPFRLFNSPEVSVLTLTSTLPENMLEEG